MKSGSDCNVCLVVAVVAFLFVAVLARTLFYTVMLTIVQFFSTIMFPSYATAEENETSVARADLGVIEKRNSTIPYFEDKNVLTVCTSEYTPSVFCAGLDNPLQWSGYEIDLFRAVMPLMGWTYDMLEFRCLDWDEMEDLLINTEECDIVTAGESPEQSLTDEGVLFSVATMDSGLGILVRAETSSTSIWYFFSAMSVAVWLALLGTAVLIGIVIWIFEVGTRSLTKETKYSTDLVYSSLNRPIGHGDRQVLSLPSNLTFLIWNFTGFIVMALYCANLTSNLTISQIQSDVRGVEDLGGRSVGSWTDYVDDLQKDYKVYAKEYPWDNKEDEKVMLNALVQGEIDALVLDYPTLAALDSANCKTKLVPTQFSLFDFAVAFPASAANRTNLIRDYNYALRNLKEYGTVEILKNKYLSGAGLECKSGKTETGKSYVTWDQVAGLWIILGGTILIGVVFVAGYRIWEAHKDSFRCCHPDQKQGNILPTVLEKMRSQTSHRYLSSDDEYSVEMGRKSSMKSHEMDLSVAEQLRLLNENISKLIESSK